MVCRLLFDLARQTEDQLRSISELKESLPEVCHLEHALISERLKGRLEIIRHLQKKLCQDE